MRTSIFIIASLLGLILTANSTLYTMDFAHDSLQISAGSKGFFEDFPEWQLPTKEEIALLEPQEYMKSFKPSDANEDFPIDEILDEGYAEESNSELPTQNQLLFSSINFPVNKQENSRTENPQGLQSNIQKKIIKPKGKSMARSAQMQSISCAQCGVLCTSRPALIQHNLEQHPIPQEKKDDITQRVQPAAFKALVSRIHSNIIQNQPEQQLSPKNNEMPNAVEAFLQCNHPNCNQFFSEKLELDHHLEIHRKMMHKCTHQNCSRTFNDEKNLKSHLKAHEEQEKEWECAPCSKTFPSKESLRAHSKIHTPCHALKLKKNILQNEESIRIMWKCTHPECTKEFLNKRGLGQHMKNHKLKHH